MKLDQFLKLIGVVQTGGEAKMIIKSGKISVNGMVEDRRGRKLNEGDQMGGDGDLFAAFDEDGNVRGVGVELSPPFGPYVNTPVWEMTMRSNIDSDVLSFKYYDASTDEIFNLIETINFQANQQLGDVFNPRVFTHCDNPISCGIYGSDEIMQCDCNTIPEDFQFNISQMSAFYFFASL